MLTTGPGDLGPCPLCGDEMKPPGRYWHMRAKHDILEDYADPETAAVKLCMMCNKPASASVCDRCCE